jgi:hypothetical protein
MGAGRGVLMTTGDRVMLPVAVASFAAFFALLAVIATSL